jgi:RNA ligase (TIGR02306 family)
LDGKRALSSKGYGAGGKVIREDDKNLYWRVARRYQLFERLEGLGDVMLFGETSGNGVQDLHYGVPRDEPAYFAFDIAIEGRYLDCDELARICAERGIPTLPLLYRGPFGSNCLALAAGREGISGKALHLREGIVIRPVKERFHPELGRVILKCINTEYLVRGGDATEFE